MKNACFILSLFLVPLFTQAYIIPTRTILQKTSENAGSGIYAIEQEVQFANGDDTLTLKETWLIENDRSMRLTVTGGKDLQNTFTLQFLYSGGQKWSLSNGSRKGEKIPEEFLEKFLHFRSPEIFANTLAQLKIIPANGFQKKPLVRAGTEFKHEAEAWVRYSRTGGTVTYAFGIATPVDKELNYPGLWIEQDQFFVRKLRLPTQVEMSANNYNQFSKGLSFPKARTIRWSNHTVTIRTLSVSARPATVTNLLQPASLDRPSNWEGIRAFAAKDIVTEFYSRFR